MLTWQVIKWLFIGCGLKGDAGDDGGGGGVGRKGLQFDGLLRGCG